MTNILHWEGQPNNAFKVTGVWNNDYAVILDGIKMNIEIERQIATKRITITATDKVDLLQVLFVVLRFENLYEGYFYNTQKLEINDADRLEKVNEWLPYYRSECRWMMIPNLSMRVDLSSVFIKWYKKVEELGIIHQMFLYASYANDLTPDVKLALILQTFEPITKELEKNKIIKVEPHNHKDAGDKRINFQDRVYCLLLKYKDLLFENDNIDIVSERAANLRNMVVHLDKEKKEVLTGEEAGYYLQKIIMMYTVLIFEMLGLEKEKYTEMIKDAVQRYEARFSELRIN